MFVFCKHEYSMTINTYIHICIHTYMHLHTNVHAYVCVLAKKSG